MIISPSSLGLTLVQAHAHKDPYDLRASSRQSLSVPGVHLSSVQRLLNSCLGLRGTLLIQLWVAKQLFSLTHGLIFALGSAVTVV